MGARVISVELSQNTLNIDKASVKGQKEGFGVCKILRRLGVILRY
jgi:hypothetical protein